MSAPRPWIEAFAPATLSNLGPGFDCLGVAIAGAGDRVRVRRAEAPGVVIRAIRAASPLAGDVRGLPFAASENTAGVALLELLRRYAPGAGLEAEIDQGLPIGSGLGSSAASACAALIAADAALELGLGPEQLVEVAREGERVACGSPHPDNVAPAIVGGIVLIAGVEPLRLCSLPAPDFLWIAVYTPGCSVSTAEARRALPERVPLAACVRQAARLGLLVHAFHTGDRSALGEAIVDTIVEPVRAAMIPGYLDAKAACQEAGAIACSISGSGPSVFAFSESEGRAKALLEILDECFTNHGVAGRGHVDRVGGGARVISPALH